MRAAILVACAAVFLLAVFWDGPEPRLPPGVLVPYEPDQDPVEPPRHWQFKDSQVTALATFRVRARVLLTAHYWWGNDAGVVAPPVMRSEEHTGAHAEGSQRGHLRILELPMAWRFDRVLVRFVGN